MAKRKKAPTAVAVPAVVQHPSLDDEVQSPRELAECVRNTFATSDGRKVWRYLQRYCRANQSVFHENPGESGRLSGKRDVYLILQHYREVDPNELPDIEQLERERQQITADPSADVIHSFAMPSEDDE